VERGRGAQPARPDAAFLDLWKNADQNLQLVVSAVRMRYAELVKQERS